MNTFYKKYFYAKISKYSNLPHYDQCPVARDNYFVKDYPMDLDVFRPFIQPGVYRADMMLLREDSDVFLAGMRIYVTVAEKPME